MKHKSTSSNFLTSSGRAEEVTIMRANLPVAILLAVKPSGTKRELGWARGEFTVPERSRIPRPRQSRPHPLRRRTPPEALQLLIAPAVAQLLQLKPERLPVFAVPAAFLGFLCCDRMRHAVNIAGQRSTDSGAGGCDLAGQPPRAWLLPQ